VAAQPGGARGALLLAVALAALCASPRSGEAQVEVLRSCEAPAPFTAELWELPEGPLLRQEAFPPDGEWREQDAQAPGLAECFGEATPSSRRFVVHALAATGPPASPVLLVPGAGDNGLRSFTLMARALADAGHPVWALTFAQPHGDNYQHAEIVAQTLRELVRRGVAAPFDLVAHSMGGLAAAVYASNDGQVDWGAAADARGAAYAANGSAYGGELRRMVLLGVPLGGADTAFRWPNNNFARVNGLPLALPVSWDRYYPSGSAALLLYQDLEPYGYFADPEIFPGQAQSLARWDHEVPLPGSEALLGWAASQQDWWTTYYGGLGFFSASQGIDAALEKGGGLIAKLQAAGLDPAIEIAVGLGRSPLLPSDYGPFTLAEDLRASYGASVELDWPRMSTAWLDVHMPWHATAWAHDLPELFRGERLLGEISGPSDGLILADSASASAGLLRRGATLRAEQTFDGLNHLELCSAGSLAALLAAQGGEASAALAEKYAEPANQSVDWVVAQLSDPAPPGDDLGPPTEDAGTPGDDLGVPGDLGALADLGGPADLGPPSDLGGADQGPAGPDLGAGPGEPDAGSVLDAGPDAGGAARPDPAQRDASLCDLGRSAWARPTQWLGLLLRRGRP